MIEPVNTRHIAQVMSQRWTCWRCFQPIGVVQGNRVTIVHHGRQITAHLPCEQVCHHCRSLNVWDENGPVDAAASQQMQVAR